MSKDKYLEDLYKELQKYEADSVIRHVTEYDYLISDMLEESSIDDVIEKLGSSAQLAQSIADEFGYTLKKRKQFEEPIISRKRDYSTHRDNSIFVKVINVLFAIGSIVFFTGFISAIFGLSVFVLLFFNGFANILLPLLTILAFSIFVFSLYMLVLNLKNLLVNRLNGYKREVM